MKVNGTAILNAPPEQAWAALNDPAVLVRTIPGCQRLEADGTDRYRMTVTAGVASIKGSYVGDVQLADHVPYSAFTLRASGAGAPGTVSADVRVTLDRRDDGSTLLSYAADAVVGGPVGGVGQRVLSGVAKKMAGEFFRAVNAEWDDPAPVDAAPAEGATPGTSTTDAASVVVTGTATTTAGPSRPVAPSGPTTFTRPVGPSGAAAGGQPAALVAATLAGGVIALLGVLVGWRISRRS